MSDYRELQIVLCPMQGEEPFCCLTVPEHITFLQLHAVIQIVLQGEGRMPFGFMLMTQRRAVDVHTAEKCEVAEAFARNGEIRYTYPYPGSPVLRLGLRDVTETKEQILYARAVYPEDAAVDAALVRDLLKKYAMFAEGWEYRPVPAAEYKREGAGAHESGAAGAKSNADFSVEKKKRKRGGAEKEKKTNTADPETTYRSGKMKERLQMLDELIRGCEEDGAIPVVIGESGYTQTELLQADTKSSLLKLCDLIGVHAPGSGSKAAVAECCAAYLGQNLFHYLLMLPGDGIYVLQRLCREKPGKETALSWEDLPAVSAMIRLGLADLIRREDKRGGETYELQAAKDIKEPVSSFFRKKKKFEIPALEAFGRNLKKEKADLRAVCDAYAELDGHVGDFLLYYGAPGVDSLRRHLGECYGYSFAEQEFLSYLRLRLVFTGQVFLYTKKSGGRKYIAPVGFDRELAARAVRRYNIKAEEKAVDPEKMEAFLAETEELRYGMVLLLADMEMEADEIGDFLASITIQIAENCSWEEFTGEAVQVAECLDSMKSLAWWYQMSHLYLNLPLSGLGGRSRTEYADGGENPYGIFSDPPEYASDEKEESMFYHSYAAQWELYQACRRLIDEGENELYEKQMLRCAKRYLPKDAAESLQCYCYMVSGNPRLIGALGKGLESGNEELSFLMNDIMAFLEELGLPEGGNLRDGSDLLFSGNPELSADLSQGEKVDVIVPFPEPMFPLNGTRKITPGSLCPCGSGKKYKDCCGKKEK